MNKNFKVCLRTKIVLIRISFEEWRYFTRISVFLQEIGLFFRCSVSPLDYRANLSSCCRVLKARRFCRRSKRHCAASRRAKQSRRREKPLIPVWYGYFKIEKIIINRKKYNFDEKSLISIITVSWTHPFETSYVYSRREEIEENE